MIRIEIKTDDTEFDDKEAEVAKVMRDMAKIIEWDEIEQDVPYVHQIRDWHLRIIHTRTF